MYSPYDYRKNGVRIELKTRNNSSDRYPTTMIGLSKVRHAESFSGKYYFSLRLQMASSTFDMMKTCFQEFQTGLDWRSDRGTVESNTYVHIPVDALKDFGFINTRFILYNKHYETVTFQVQIIHFLLSITV
jgi:hypothetical protein